MDKKEIIEKYKTHTNDTGSSAVQIALLTVHISELTEHLKVNPKDFSTLRGLQRMVAKRKRHMKYLSNKNNQQYRELISSLGIRG